MTSVVRGSDNFDSAKAVPIVVRFNLAGVGIREVLDIPTWVERITIDYAAVSGGSDSTLPRVRLGLSTGTYPTSYAGATVGESAGGASAGSAWTSAGYLIFGAWAAASSVANGQVVLVRVLDSGSASRWVGSVKSGHSAAAYAAGGGGYGDFAGVVDRLQFLSGGANFTGGDIVVRMEA